VLDGREVDLEAGHCLPLLRARTGLLCVAAAGKQNDADEGEQDATHDTIVLMAAVWRQLGSSGNRALGAERAMLLEPASYVLPAGFCTRQSAQPERSKGPSRER
jgi:hypothetical protein